MELPYEHILAEPKEKSDKAVILLPGISGKALSDKYKGLEEGLSKVGYSFLRFDLWKDVPDVLSKTFQDIYKGIDTALEFLKSKGYSKISFVGKSFGGGILLTYPMDVSSLVLWAPAIGFNEESNLETVISRRLSEFEKLDEIKINKNDLSKIYYPTLVIQGNKDDVVSLENSQEIVEALPNGKLEIIEGAGHSYEKEGEMEEVEKLTIGFFKNF